MRNGPAFDPELARLLPEVPEGGASMTPERIGELRAAMAAAWASDDDIRAAAEVAVSHRDAGGVPLLIVTPVSAAPARAWIYHVHGGGLVAGSHRSGMAELARVAVELNAAVVSVDYRLAPEHPHPAALDDVVAGLVWSVAHAGELGLDPHRLVVMGGSAGGGIAAALALACRDRGGPAIARLVLVQPMLDDRNATPSTHELDDDIVWDRTSNATGWTAYLGGAPATASAAPARAEDLRGLPSVYLEVGDADIFRDECLDFARRLSLARVPVELHVWPGGFHGFDAYDVPIARAAVAARVDHLRRALAASAFQ